MKRTVNDLGYYFITDHNLSKAGNESDILSAIEAGAGLIQYRNKTSKTKEFYSDAKKLKTLCKDKNTIFIINDRLDIALSVNADGVHLGQDDMPIQVAREILGNDKIIGMTVHTKEEAITAEDNGADYLSIAPIYPTATKKDSGLPCGIELIRQIKDACAVPLFAIGGINLSNAKEVIDAGADGLCAISAVITKDDVKKEIEKYQEMFR